MSLSTANTVKPVVKALQRPAEFSSASSPSLKFKECMKSTVYKKGEKKENLNAEFFYFNTSHLILIRNEGGGGRRDFNCGKRSSVGHTYLTLVPNNQLKGIQIQFVFFFITLKFSCEICMPAVQTELLSVGQGEENFSFEELMKSGA